MTSISKAKLASGCALLLLTISTVQPANAAPLSAAIAMQPSNAIVLIRDGGHGGGHGGGHHGGAMGFHGGMGGGFGGASAGTHGPAMSQPRMEYSFAPRHAYHPRPHWRGYPSSYFWTPPYVSYRSRYAYNNDACFALKQKSRRTGSAYWRKRYDACRS